MNNNFFDGLDELYHRAKLGDDRTTRAGCRCENVVFGTVFLFVCLSGSESRAPCVRRGAYFEQALRCHLQADLDAVFSFFSEVIALSGHYIVRIFVARWRHNFDEIGVKNCEKSKNRRKSMCTRLRVESCDI